MLIPTSCTSNTRVILNAIQNFSGALCSMFLRGEDFEAQVNTDLYLNTGRFFSTYVEHLLFIF